ncbi:MAG: sodium:alanine symporter family protein [Coriobacteriaceae bacterium]|nr:sodium:alanine symporter family protein [Coriobacteriaceae bacterium]
MDAFIDAFSAGVAAVDDFVWGWVMIVLLVGTHIFMTIRTRFIQRKIVTGIKLSVTGNDPKAEGDVSQFGALTSALAATIGTGNIVGVATGLLFGGPGAIFWMWITGVFGIATKYSECYISMKYRVKDHRGNMLGGAMYALERGFKHKGIGKTLAILFAIFAAVASFGIGASVQSNSVTGVVVSYVNQIPGWLMGIILVVLVAIVILGGIRSIANVCEKLVPSMAILYSVGCIVIICMNWQYVGPAISEICVCAFTGHAAFGGVVGSGIMLALQYGFKRGLFSNESGMGSAPLVASSAVSRNPARQALVSMTGTFWDTVVVCALTGIMLVSTMLAHPEIAAEIEAGNIAAGADLSTTAFNSIPIVGPIVLGVGMICFAYSTMLGWSYYGNRAITYLFGKHAIIPYYVVFLIFVFWGCISQASVVWDISDITNALMAVPNCIAVLVLSNVIARETKHFVYDHNLDEEVKEELPVLANK